MKNIYNQIELIVTSIMSSKKMDKIVNNTITTKIIMIKLMMKV